MTVRGAMDFNYSFIHSFILNIYIASPQENYSEALTMHQHD